MSDQRDDRPADLSGWLGTVVRDRGLALRVLLLLLPGLVAAFALVAYIVLSDRQLSLPLFFLLFLGVILINGGGVAVLGVFGYRRFRAHAHARR